MIIHVHIGKVVSAAVFSAWALLDDRFGFADMSIAPSQVVFD